jgi:hypothetical protein
VVCLVNLDNLVQVDIPDGQVGLVLRAVHKENQVILDGQDGVDGLEIAVLQGHLVLLDPVDSQDGLDGLDLLVVHRESLGILVGQVGLV